MTMMTSGKKSLLLINNYILIKIKLKECRNSMDLPTSTDPHRISLKLATQYWVTVYQKWSKQFVIIIITKVVHIKWPTQDISNTCYPIHSHRLPKVMQVKWKLIVKDFIQRKTQNSLLVLFCFLVFLGQIYLLTKSVWFLIFNVLFLFMDYKFCKIS